MNYAALQGINSDGSKRAGIHALAATYAFVIIGHDLRVELLGFRGAAPLTAQGTPLHEDGVPYTRSIVNSEPLDSKYETL